MTDLSLIKSYLARSETDAMSNAQKQKTQLDEYRELWAESNAYPILFLDISIFVRRLEAQMSVLL